jgi:hypothetical protein
MGQRSSSCRSREPAVAKGLDFNLFATGGDY